MNEQIKRLCADCEAAQESMIRGLVEENAELQEENERLRKELAERPALSDDMKQFLDMFEDKMKLVEQYKDVAPDSNLKALALYNRLTAKNFCSDALAQSPPDGAPGENEEGSGELE